MDALDLPESQLNYYKNRYFSPDLGRFVGRDPLFNSQITLYEYAGDNPLNRLDPLGLQDIGDLMEDYLGELTNTGLGTLGGWLADQFESSFVGLAAAKCMAKFCEDNKKVPNRRPNLGTSGRINSACCRKAWLEIGGPRTLNISDNIIKCEKLITKTMHGKDKGKTFMEKCDPKPKPKKKPCKKKPKPRPKGEGPPYLDPPKDLERPDRGGVII